MAKKPNQTDATAKLWVRIICGFLGFLMIFGVLVMAISVFRSNAAEMPPANTQPDQQISVGLYCNETAVQSYTLYSDQGFQLKLSPSEQTIILDSSTLTTAVDANLYRVGDALYTESVGIATVGGYHIQLTQFTFSDLNIDNDHDNPVYIRPDNSQGSADGYTPANVNEYIELLSTNEAFQTLNFNAFPYYESAELCYIRVGSFYTAAEAENALEQLKSVINVSGTIVSPDENTLSFLDKNYSILCEFAGKGQRFEITPQSNDRFYDANNRQYYGNISITRSSSASSKGLTVINNLSLETYISVLLSAEVSSAWNDELLKAMSVLLRTKITKKLGFHHDDGFDVCGNSHCHMYLGNAPITEKIISIVESTKGQVLTYEEKLIFTPYSMYNGSSTISSADAFGTDLPYLTSLYTPWEDSKPWNAEFTPYELYQILSSAGYSEIQGNIDTLKVIKRADGSDYVTELQVTDIFGTSVTIQGSETIRLLFGGKLPSSCFIVGKSGETIAYSHRTYTNDTDYTESPQQVTLSGTHGNFVFMGSGEGCGVGFSIWGGLMLAEKGMTYDKILATYFPNTVLEN